MISVKVHDVVVLVGILTFLSVSFASPDSAGIVEMVDGLAYGGIPYGSVSGMVRNYPGTLDERDSSEMINQISYQPQNQRQYYQTSSSRIIITPNLRASGIARRQRGPVQIYRLPGVIAPGVVGTFSQIGY